MVCENPCVEYFHKRPMQHVKFSNKTANSKKFMKLSGNSKNQPNRSSHFEKVFHLRLRLLPNLASNINQEHQISKPSGTINFKHLFWNFGNKRRRAAALSLTQVLAEKKLPRQICRRICELHAACFLKR